jgi:hypothetical protein
MVTVWVEAAVRLKLRVQESLKRRDERRPDGTASTITHSATIAKPMNSNTNASTAKLPGNKTIRLSGTR